MVISGLTHTTSLVMHVLIGGVAIWEALSPRVSGDELPVQHAAAAPPSLGLRLCGVRPQQSRHGQHACERVVVAHHGQTPARVLKAPLASFRPRCGAVAGHHLRRHDVPYTPLVQQGEPCVRGHRREPQRPQHGVHRGP